MKKIGLIITLIAILVGAFFIIMPDSKVEAKNDTRLQTVSIEQINKYYWSTIMYDKETKVMYMVITRDSKSDRWGQLIVMQDKDGKPLLYDENKG